ncbi:MAG: cryptochrome/photolyase family protein, partial [Cyclobacteriaceae bacterium]|nr:cryptochrome/photolyase family protein [Cyclobacteriaceae bacterium SS2]
MEVALIFPHQLFEDNPLAMSGRRVYLVEEYLFFRQYRFHKQKLAFHRASMKQYAQFLLEMGCEVTYVESHQEESDVRKLIPQLKAEKVHCIDPVDDYLKRRIEKGCKEVGIELKFYESLAFINRRTDLETFFKPDKKKYFQTEFYIQQRKSLGILLDDTKKPIGGKWSFDQENRKKYPKKSTPPSISYPSAGSDFKSAVEYINQYFPENWGNLGSYRLYPTNFSEAKSWLTQFLEDRFHGFGDYEDAIVANESILHHSVLSPLINVGLLTPDYVVDEIMSYAENHDIPINNTEGIIRQIIGWREFIRGVYEVAGAAERTTNYFNFDRKIPDSFYTATTGIDPVDMTIRKLLNTGYTHHIERLMVLGNFMLLCEINPDEVYRWFMEMYIDAYDWVMVPNVYGMSQFADGGLMSTKPYISGSNYLMKMSD